VLPIIYSMGAGLTGLPFVDMAANRVPAGPPPPAQRALYLGFTNTVFGVAIFTSSMGGLIVEWAGFAVLLVVSACLWTLALLLSLLLIEPRDGMKQHEEG
jgi:predicted MFS family arabinose efflux permease